MVGGVQVGDFVPPFRPRSGYAKPTSLQSRLPEVCPLPLATYASLAQNEMVLVMDLGVWEVYCGGAGSQSSPVKLWACISLSKLALAGSMKVDLSRTVS